MFDGDSWFGFHCRKSEFQFSLHPPVVELVFLQMLGVKNPTPWFVLIERA